MSAKKDSAAEGPDPDHLATLKRGVTEWNAWRDAHARALPNFAGADLHDEDLSGANLSEAKLVRADLSGANLCLANLFGAGLCGAKLSGTDLSGANLSGTDLSEANLSGADLSGADLSGANLSGANLSGANLSGADLSGANLGWADLSGANLGGADFSGADLCLANLFEADLSGADLSGADLSGANLGGADLSGADLHEATDSSGSDFSGVSLGETRLADANLRNVRGLETVRHEGHGTLEHRTRAQSGPLPEGVLTGIGRPEMPDHSLRVEFNESVWRDLFVVEFGLREVLGDQAYSLEKHDDQLTVTFRSPEDFQKGLETVVAQLAAQEQVKPGILVACTLKETDAPLEIGGEQLRRLLGIVAEELRAGKADTQLSVSHTEHEDPHALTTRQDTLHKAVECLPANFAAPLVGRLLEERTVRTREGSMSDIYDRSMLGLQYVNRRMSLEAGAERIPADPAPGDADSEV